MGKSYAAINILNISYHNNQMQTHVFFNFMLTGVLLSGAMHSSVIMMLTKEENYLVEDR